MKRLSKSRIQNGRQCHRRLWLECHQRDAAVWTDSAAARLAEGTDFGVLAQALLGGGYVVEANHFQLREALADTAAHLSDPSATPSQLFEAAFEHQNVSVRVDAFLSEADGDHLIEVKSSTSVKDPYLWDCAIQTWVARGAGRPVSRVSLAHVDREFVLETAGDYRGLLAIEDITDEVEVRQSSMEELVIEMQAVADGAEPVIATGPHCTSPYACPFTDHCRREEPAPPDFPVDLLPYGGKLVEQLRSMGIDDIRDAPDDLVSNPKHARIIQASRSGEAYVSDELAPELGSIAYPRYFIDFETIQFVVPRWIGTRPFQQIPFQFSCHVDTGGEPLSHHDFLDLSGEDPSRDFAQALIDSVGRRGSVLVWNRSFEAGRVRELAARFPDLAAALGKIEERMIDLLPIYRQHYYHPDMRGSWSIKAVLPTVAPDLDYGALEVGDGNAAQDAYRHAIATDVAPAEKDRIEAALRDYCRLDTLAMVRLIDGPKS